MSPTVRQSVPLFQEALLSIDRLRARQIVEELRKDFSPLEIAEGLLVPALEFIGKGWEEGTFALSQVYMSGRISEELIDDLLPTPPGKAEKPALAIAVLDDHHLLGKRLVYSIMRVDGLNVADYGTMDVDGLVERTLADQIKVLLISTLMLPSALRIKEVTAKLQEQGASVKVVVGGAPFRFDRQLWREVNADAMGVNAADAVALVKKLWGGDRS